MKIVVKPVERQSVQRRHLTPVQVYDPDKKQMVDTGHVSGKLKAKDALEKLPFTPDREKRRFRTGLEEMIDNPFKGMKPLELKQSKALPDKWQPLLSEIVKAEQISKQTYFEILDGVEPDFYSPNMPSDLIRPETLFSTDHKREKTFIERFSITLYDGANVFHSDTSRGRFAIQLLKNCPLVAENRDVANANYHNWYIAEENEEELDRVKMDDMENEAIAELAYIQNKFPEFDLYRLAGQLMINSTPLVRGEASNMIVKDQLNRFIKNKGKHKKQNIADFLKATGNFKDNLAKFEVDYLVAQARAVNLLSTDKGSVVWVTKAQAPEIYKWRSFDAFTAFMLDEKLKYNPKSKSDSIYSDFLDDLAKRGVRIK